MFKVLMTNFTEWDTRLFFRIFNLNGKRLLDRAVVMITRTADGYLFPVVACCLLLFDPTGAKMLIVSGVAAFAVELSVHHFLKRGIRRNRPFNTIIGIRYLLAPPDKFSFPSGHTAAAFLMATLLAALYPQIAALLFFWALLVGVSRVYLGLHYPTDVLAGAVLGILSAKFGITFMTLI